MQANEYESEIGSIALMPSIHCIVNCVASHYIHKGVPESEIPLVRVTLWDCSEDIIFHFFVLFLAVAYFHQTYASK